MNIRQAEVWLVTFYPQIGGEITKQRPAIVISHNTMGRLPLKTIVPITAWNPRYSNYPWMIRLEKGTLNGLSKTSAIDCFQIKNFSDERFVQRIGVIDDEMLEHIHQTIAKTFNPIYRLDQ